jgi:ABC-type polysaccharide/polyol phosphate export permease
MAKQNSRYLVQAVVAFILGCISLVALFHAPIPGKLEVLSTFFILQLCTTASFVVSLIASVLYVQSSDEGDSCQ